MTPERWQQVKSLFHRVRELAPEERSSFLDHACSADHSLRREVESLLSSDREARSDSLESSRIELTLVPGTKLGDYEVQNLIGTGGMGEVYRARDLRLRRDVAIKVLPSLLSHDGDRLRRFEQEAQAAAALNHPNILAVYQMGSYEGAAYLVSELLEGNTLRDQLLSGPLSIRKAIDFGMQIAHGLDAAHEKGIVHRDLKPENLFVTKDGRLKILDFGLAKLTRAQSISHSTPTATKATEPGVVMGTVGYMSPEQVRGETADHRADIFAFGSILYEMLTGRRAFRKQTCAETMTAILNEDPPSIRHFAHAVPPALQRVVDRCIEKNPERRFQSASDLTFALGTFSESGGNRSMVGSAAKIQLSRHVTAGLALVLAVLVLIGIGKFREQRRSITSAPIKSLAVLPLENLSGDPAQEYFVDGMTDELTTNLAKIAALRVISRTSVMRYKGTKKSLPEIARELNVDGIIEGSAERSGDRVRITAQLIHGPSDTHLWAESYERDVGNLLALQDEVAKAIADEVKINLTAHERAGLTSSRPVSSEAHEAYLRGRYYWDQRTAEGEEKGLQYFRQAIALDPGYAQAYAGVADSYIVLAAHGRLPVEEAFPKARAAANRALELDQMLAEAHTSLGTVKTLYDWDWPGSEREFRRALELNPNYPTTHHWYSHYLAAIGSVDEAVAEMKKARELDPFNLSVNVWLAKTLYYSHQYDLAIEQYRRTLDLYPGFVAIHGSIGDCYAQKGMFAEGVAEWQKRLTLSGDAERAASLGRAYAASGYTGYLRKRLDLLKASAQAKPISPTDFDYTYVTVSPLDFAYTYALLGDKDHALEWLEKAYDERDPWLYLKVAPLLDGLRAEPRFKDLLRRMGLPQ